MFLLDKNDILVLILGIIKMQRFGKLSLLLDRTTTRLVGGTTCRETTCLDTELLIVDYVVGSLV